MNDKYAYCTVITNNNYIPCIIRQKQRMEYLKCKYPFIVLVTENVPKATIKKLEDNNIEYKIVPYYQFLHQDKYYQDTINKFHALSLIEYDKILFLDADTIIIDNFDILFDKYYIKKNHYFYFFTSVRYDKIQLNADGTFFFCKPNLYLYDLFFKKNIQLYKSLFRNDEQLINTFFFQSFNFDTFDTFPKFLHFAGHIKLWELSHKSKYLNNFFYQMDNFNFNKEINNIKNKNLLKLMDLLEPVNDLITNL